jgi:lipopolysaccharide export system permease protein
LIVAAAETAELSPWPPRGATRFRIGHPPTNAAQRLLPKGAAASAAPHARRPIVPRFTRIDRYLLSQIVRPFALILVVIVSILFLENLSRLLQLLEHVRSPLPILGRFTLFLLPEYFGLGILVALFLSVAMTVRTATLRGEWQIFAAIGITPARLALVPLLLGAVGATAEVAINFHFRPIGEYRLDRLIGDVRDGRYGLGGEVGTILHLGQGVTMTVDAFGPQMGRFENIFIAQRDTILSARSAKASFDDAGRLNLLLEHGQSLSPRSDGSFGVLSFERLRVDLATRERQAVRRVLETELDRLTYGELLRRIEVERVQDRPKRIALASFASRCGYAVIAFMMPLLGLALGAPSLRGRSGYGLGCGIVVIVSYVKAVSFVETQFASAPLMAFGLLFATFTTIIIGLWSAENRFGPGFAETWLEQRLVKPTWQLFRNLRRPGQEGHFTGL